MATGGRRRFLPIALRCFARRTYRNAELLIVDDGERSVRSLCEGLADVRYLRVRPMTAGMKLNTAIQAARGDVLQKLDDDDWYGPGFIASSVKALQGRDPERTLVARCCFLTLVRSDGVLRESGHGWTAGGGFCFHRALWQKIPFRDTRTSEDSHFLRDHRPEVVRVCAAEEYVVVRHGENTWQSVGFGRGEGPVGVDEHFRAQPAYAKDRAQVLDPETCEDYRRVLRWRR